MGHLEAARPDQWTHFYLYVILDVFSRDAVGWTVQHRETATLAEQLITQTLEKRQIRGGQLTIHARSLRSDLALDVGHPERIEGVDFRGVW